MLNKRTEVVSKYRHRNKYSHVCYAHCHTKRNSNSNIKFYNKYNLRQPILCLKLSQDVSELVVMVGANYFI